VREILASELRPNLQVLATLEDLRLPIKVSKGAAVLVPGRGQVVVVPRAGQLHGFQASLRRRAADHQGDVVRRASRRPKRLQFFLDEGLQLLRVQQRLCLLEEVRLVSGAAALRHKHEGILAALRGHEVNLRGQIRLGVSLGEHGHRRDLRVAQVPPGECVVDPAGEVLLILAVREDTLATLSQDNGRACVLAPRQHTLRCDRRVLEQVPGRELVVVGRLGVLQDLRELGEVPGTEVVLDLGDAPVGELR